MNETFEKIDFSLNSEKNSNFSFYEYTKNPLKFEECKEEINFFEKFHINFNINNMIFNDFKDEQEVDMVVVNNENIQENMNTKESNIRLANSNINNFENNSSEVRQDTDLIGMEDRKQLGYLGQFQQDNLNPNQNMSLPQEISHEDFNNMNDCGLHGDNYNMNNSNLDYENYSIKSNNIRDNSNDNTHIQINKSKQNYSEFPIHNKDTNHLSDKFNILAYKPKNKIEKSSHGEDKYNMTKNINITSQIDYQLDKIGEYTNVNKSSVVNMLSSQTNKSSKLLTKEYFSQQVNSIGNIQAFSQVPEITDLENKYGLGEGSYECPDYNSFSEEKLKEEMKKYGLKAASVKFMVKTLNQIWEFMHIKRLPENLKSDLSKFLNENPVENSSSNVFQEFSSTGKSNIKHLNDVKKEKIISSIQEDPNLWIKILRFNKVELKEIKEVLNKKGIIVENEILKAFLIELGVMINQIR